MTRKIVIALVIVALLLIAAANMTEQRVYLPGVHNGNVAMYVVTPRDTPTSAPTQNPFPGDPTPTPITICIPEPCGD